MVIVFMKTCRNVQYQSRRNNMADRIELGGLWKSEKCLSGNLGQARLVIFPNERKTKDNAPDYFMFLYPGKRQEEWEAKKKDDVEVGKYDF